MLEIVEDTPERLVLEDRRMMFRVLAAVFTCISGVALTAMLLQVYQTVILERADITRMATMVVFVLIEVGFVAIGFYALFVLSRGVRVVFDRRAETVTLTMARWLQRHTREYPIYSVSHVRVERNEEMRAFALYLVLRSGEQIALAALPEHAGEHLEILMHRIRAFLRA